MLGLYRQEDIVALVGYLLCAARGGSAYLSEVRKFFRVCVIGENRGIAELSLDTLEYCAAHITDADKSELFHN